MPGRMVPKGGFVVVVAPRPKQPTRFLMLRWKQKQLLETMNAAETSKVRPLEAASCGPHLGKLHQLHLCILCLPCRPSQMNMADAPTPAVVAGNDQGPMECTTSPVESARESLMKMDVENDEIAQLLGMAKVIMTAAATSQISDRTGMGVQRHRSSPGRTGCLGWYRWYWSHDVMAWWLKFEFWKFSVRPRSKEAGGGHRQWDCCFFVLSLGYIHPETTWKWMVGRVASCWGGLFFQGLF